MKKRLTLTAALLCALLTAICAIAGMAFPGLLTFEQDGVAVKGYNRGDEYCHYCVDEQGSVFVEDDAGNYRYVVYDSGASLASGTIASGVPSGVLTLDYVKSAGLNIETVLAGLAGGMGANARMDYSNEPANDIEPLSNDSNGLLFAAAPAIREKLPLLAISVRFEKNPEVPDYTDAAIHERIFGEGTSSVSGYYKSVSQGRQYYVPAEESSGTANDGVIKVTLAGEHPVLTRDENFGDRSEALFEASVRAALNYFDIGSFDTNGDEFISTDELTIVLLISGYEESSDARKKPDVWAHATNLDTDSISFNGYAVGNYIMQGQTHGFGGEVEYLVPIGTLAHELGHHRGLPDLYSVDGSPTEHAVGANSVMASGSWGAAAGEYPGTSPTAMSAWGRVKLGYCDTITLEPNSVEELMHELSGKHTVVKVETTDPQEYFLIENRYASGIDKGYYFFYGNKEWSRGGIVVWHIDERIINEYGPLRAINTAGHVPGIMPVYFSDYPERPFFTSEAGYSALSDFTAPCAKLHNGEGSGLNIEILSGAGDVMKIKTPASSYRASVSGGYFDKDKSKTTGEYAVGTSVTVQPDIPEGKWFSRWVCSPTDLAIKQTKPEDESKKIEYSFQMPARDVTLTAEFTPIPTYSVTIDSDGAGAYGAGNYPEGAQVSVYAGTKEGCAFSCWKDKAGNTVATSATYSFAMPAKSVFLTAVFIKAAKPVESSASDTPAPAPIALTNIKIVPENADHVAADIVKENPELKGQIHVANGTMTVNLKKTADGAMTLGDKAELSLLKNSGVNELALQNGGAQAVLAVDDIASAGIISMKFSTGEVSEASFANAYRAVYGGVEYVLTIQTAKGGADIPLTLDIPLKKGVNAISIDPPDTKYAVIIKNGKTYARITYPKTGTVTLFD